MHISSMVLVPREDYTMWAKFLCMGAGVVGILGSGPVDQLIESGLTGDCVM